MLLNLDLGSLYLKCALVNDNKVIRTEIIKMEKNTFSIIEVLINDIVATYKSQYPIKKINIIPNLQYMEFQIINSESIMETKYQNYMKNQISKEIKEQKKRDRTGEEYTPTIPKKAQEYKDINFKHNLETYDIFHSVERSNLMETDILLEYIDKTYFEFLKKVVTKLGKEVSIISPIRVLRALPTAKGKRIIINYGANSILYVHINESNYIIKVEKQGIPKVGDNSFAFLSEKHRKISEPDGSYIGIKEGIKLMMGENPNTPIYLLGGNSIYLQNDLNLKNDLKHTNLNEDIPLVIENLVLGVTFNEYNDLQYNNVTMNIKNRLLSTMSSTSDISNTIIALVGDITIILLLIYLISNYKLHHEYVSYKREYDSLRTQIEAYEGSAGKIARLESSLSDIKEGKVINYYNVAEVLKTMESPLELSYLNINENDVKMVSYADNTSLIHQFLSTVELKQMETKYSSLRLKETDIKTIYKNGEKLDRVEFTGRIEIGE